MIRVPVPLADRPYDVWVGEGAASLLADVLPAGVDRLVVVSQPGVPDLVERDRVVARCEIGDGEAHKSLATVEQLCRDFARAGLTRRDCVVAVGGGMVTDVAGFAAASYHRGVAVVHVPTTLLGMVDAAIGGKTGVNLPEGKNLVGAFWQPAAVLCDLDRAGDVAGAGAPERVGGDGQVPLPHRRRPHGAAPRGAGGALRRHQGRSRRGRRA